MNRTVSYSIQTLDNIFTAAPCGVLAVDEESREMQFANDAYFALVGYTRKEYETIIGSDYSRLLFEADKNTVERETIDLYQSGGIANRDYRIVRHDGSVRWIKMNAVKMIVNKKRCALCFFNDITDQKTQLSCLKLIAQNIDSSISLIRIKDSAEELLYANDLFYELIGVSREKYRQDMRISEMGYVSENDKQRTADAIKPSLLTGKPMELEYRLLRQDAQPRWMSRRLSTLKLDEPNTYFMVSIATDITAKKKAEMTRALEERRYQLVIDEMKAAVFEWDMQSGEFYSSENYKEYAISEVSSDLMLKNKGPMDTIHPDDLSALKQFFDDSKNKVDRSEVTLRLKLTAGGYRWCRMVGLFYRDEAGRLLRALGVVIDISEERERSAMLDSLVNRLPGGAAIFRVAQKLECQYFSDGFKGISGFTREALESLAERGDLFERSVYPPDLPLCLNKIRTLSAKGLPINFTYRSIRSDGTFQWLTMSASLIREENGCPVYYCIFTTPPDEASLYQSMAENSSIGIIVSDTKTHDVYYTNRAFRDMMHIKDDAPSCKKCYEYVRGQTQPCQSCAAPKLKPGESVTAIHHFPQFGTYLKVRSSLVQWAGHTALLEYNVDITEEYQERIQQQELINKVPAGLGFTEIIDGKVQAGYLNDYYYSMVGESRDQRLSKMNGDILFFTHRDDIHKHHIATKKLIDGSNKESVLHRILCGDGKYRWFRLDLSVAHRDGARLKVYTSYVDCDEITRARIAQEKAAAVLQRQYEMERSQKALLEQERATAFQFNATKGNLVKITKTRNISFTFQEGDSIESIIKEMQKLIPTQAERESFAQFYDCDKNIAKFKKGLTDFSCEFRVRQKDGCLHWMQHVCRMMQDESGDVIIYVFVNDISSERNNELAIQSVIDDEMNVILLVNAITGVARILRINRGRVYSLYQINEAFPYERILHNQNISTVIPENLSAARAFLKLNNIIDALKTEPYAAITVFKTTNTGARRLIKVQAAYLDDVRENIVITSKDITESYAEEQRVKQGLEAANKAKAEFLSRVSHDMRTPLNAVLGFTKLLQEETKLPDQACEYLKNINDSSQYLLGLISDVLDMSKIEEGKLELHPEPYYYKEFEQTLRTFLMPKAQEKGVEFIMQCRVTAPETAYFDKLRLQQIFVNLIGNAIKFTPKGGRVEFTITGGNITDDMHMPLTFIVRDNGIGMSKEFLQNRMFRPFEQEQLGGDQTETGTGLGLSIAKQLVEQMGGAIRCESTLGSGTTFTVVLSPAIGEKYDDIIIKRSASHGHERLSGARILLCEDNNLNTIIAKKLLEKNGCAVTAVQNGKQGVEAFLASIPGTYGAILMDIRMPVMDGLDAAKAIRALDRADALTIPIIAMSANAFEEDVNASLSAGMQAHLTKPIEPQRLYDTLCELILGQDK